MRSFLKFLVLLVLFNILSCKKEKELEKYNGEILCEVIKRLNENDQKYRGLDHNPFFQVLDSIKKAEGITHQDHLELSNKEQLALGDRARLISNKKSRKFTQHERDSLMKLQIQLDNKNSEILIDIVQSRGYPHEGNCECKEFPHFIFTHSQPQYHDKIQAIIDSIKVNEGTDLIPYDFINYHINGRNNDFFNK